MNYSRQISLYDLVSDLPVFDGSNIHLETFANYVNYKATFIPLYLSDDFVYILINECLSGEVQNLASKYEFNDYSELLNFPCFHATQLQSPNIERILRDFSNSYDSINMQEGESVEEYDYRFFKIVVKKKFKLNHYSTIYYSISNKLNEEFRKIILSAFLKGLTA